MVVVSHRRRQPRSHPSCHTVDQLLDAAEARIFQRLGPPTWKTVGLLLGILIGSGLLSWQLWDATANANATIYPYSYTTTNNTIRNTNNATLPIYWINRAKDTEKRAKMEHMLKEAILRQNTMASPPHQDWTNLPRTAVVKRVVPSFESLPDMPKAQLDTLAQGMALERAYQDGHEYALILEDRVQFSFVFLDHWKTYVSMAPEGWELLQFSTTNSVVQAQGETIFQEENLPLVRPWVAWQFDHWSSGWYGDAYLVSRQGMKRILKGLTNSPVNDVDGDPREPIVWSLPEDLLFLGKSLIVYLVREHAYTAAVPLIFARSKADGPSSAHASPLMLGKSQHQHQQQQLRAAQTSGGMLRQTPTTLTQEEEKKESVLVLMSIPIDYNDDGKTWDEGTPPDTRLLLHLKRLKEDATELCGNLYQGAICEWHVQLAFVVPGIPIETAQTWHRRAQLPDYVHLHLQRLERTPSRDNHQDDDHQWFEANKLAFWAQFAASTDQRHPRKSYTKWLLKDHEQRLVGFPWKAFVKTAGDAILSAPLRQNPRPSQPKPPYLYSNAFLWKAGNPDCPTGCWTGDYQKIQPADLPFLESYLVWMDGNFADWFFSKLVHLLPKSLWEEWIPSETLGPDGRQPLTMYRSSTAFGPEFVWCGAAAEHAPDRPSCRLVPLVSSHETPPAQYANAPAELPTEAFPGIPPAWKALDTDQGPLQRWMDHTKPWLLRSTVLTLEAIEGICRVLLAAYDPLPDVTEDQVAFNLTRCVTLFPPFES